MAVRGDVDGAATLRVHTQGSAILTLVLESSRFCFLSATLCWERLISRR